MKKWLQIILMGIPLVFLVSQLFHPIPNGRPYMKSRRTLTPTQNMNVVLDKIKNGMQEAYSHVLASVKPSSHESIATLEESLMRVMSFNVRCDEEKEEFETLWDQRKNQVASVIRFHRVDIAGLQEPFQNQMEDLKATLSDYDWVGVGLNNGKDSGPMDAILYLKSRFEVKESGNFYLSTTPLVPSIGWDAKFPRGVTWAKFYDKKSDKTFYVFNTHFDYHGKMSRDESAYLLRGKISQIAKDIPFIVTGDFNLFPDLGGEETYRILTQGNEEEGKLLIDAQHIAKYPHHGPTGSWSGFKEAGQPGVKPDYIFVGESLDVITHGILADCFDEGKFPSDHLPIVADIQLKTP